MFAARGILTRSLVGLALALIAAGAQAAGIRTNADASGPTQILFAPATTPAPLIILISGQSGFDLYTDYADKISKLGYYTVLLDGNDILAPDQKGGERLKQAIARAQATGKVTPGKVPVIGFSLGGGAALTYAARNPVQVSVVIVYFPDTDFILKTSDPKTFVAKNKVPVLFFAAGKDTYKNCCLVETAKALAAAAKEVGVPFELVVYPQAKHDFINKPDYRADDAADAWKRTLEALKAHAAPAVAAKTE